MVVDIMLAMTQYYNNKMFISMDHLFYSYILLNYQNVKCSKFWCSASTLPYHTLFLLRSGYHLKSYTLLHSKTHLWSENSFMDRKVKHERPSLKINCEKLGIAGNRT